MAEPGHHQRLAHRVPCPGRALLFGRQDALTGRQRNGRLEDIVGIVLPLGLDQPIGVATVAFRRAFHSAAGEEVWIPARQCNAVEGPTRGLHPPPMPALVTRLRPISDGYEYLDQDMIAAKAEGGCGRRHARGGPPELMGDDGAARRRCSGRRTYEDVDSLAIERSKPARLHEYTLAGHEKWIEYCERRAIGCRGQRVGDERSEPSERRQARL